jgi:phosphotransferase system enzyme I (PtsI)
LVFHKRLEGVGLFRTDFLLLDTTTFPDEDQQYVIYIRTIEAISKRPVVMRTFDLGVEKRPP